MTFNANGIRSAASKGFFDWFAQHDVDVLCLQETKAQAQQLNDAALKSGADRLFSSYQITPDLKLWIITEWDRSVTTLLLPSEY